MLEILQIDEHELESGISLLPPNALRAELPLSSGARKTVMTTRSSIQKKLSGNDSRHLMIVGPCSIHNTDAALTYAERLKMLSDDVGDCILLIMRLYFEKPRTLMGWKGLVYDPDLDGSCNIEKGIRLARRLLLDVCELGVPSATEILDPIILRYIEDLISWAAIGARTTESQTHRQAASGLSMPLGFKNTTGGDVQAAIDGIKTAASPHTFLGVGNNGHIEVFRTSGNPLCHLILRGDRNNKQNYESDYIECVTSRMKEAGITPNIVIDCSHGNSAKDPRKQVDVMLSTLRQIKKGNAGIIGTMLESNLMAGSQDTSNAAMIEPHVSVTDPCLGWNETEELIRKVHNILIS